MIDELTLEQGRKRIFAAVPVPPVETVEVMHALGRVTAASSYAPCSLPEYSQSLYDGYAIGKKSDSCVDGLLEYQLAGEIAAGDTVKKKIVEGSAFRIMTGALIPQNTWKVIPQENCREEKNRVFISFHTVAESRDNISRRGSKLRKGSLLVQKGAYLSPGHLARLVESDFTELDVFCRPKVAFFCTGSELVENTRDKRQGKKLSSNRYLLSGLVRQFGGEALDYGSCEDMQEVLQQKILEVTAANPAVIITTGGMGPGKYDLLESSFQKVGGRSIFSSLRLRPGKSVLFGTLGKSIFFGLPGPPSAVQALFHVIIRPALLALQGYKDYKPELLQGRLTCDLAVSRTKMLRLLEGVYYFDRGICMARLPYRGEPANCYLFCRKGKKNFRQGTNILLQPFRSPCNAF